MRRLYSRIYFHFVAVLLLVGIAASAMVATGGRAEFVHHFAERLALHAAALVGDDFDSPVARRRVVHRLADGLEIDVTVRDAQGHLLESAGTPLPPPEHGLGGAQVFARHKGSWYVAAPIVGPTGQFLGTLEAALALRMAPPKLLLRPLLAVALMLLVVAMATGPLARRISAPVERLTAASRRFGAGDLSVRVEPSPPRRGRKRWRGRHEARSQWHRHHEERVDELDGLVKAWNEMAERVEGLVRGQKELLANVSHELRSPLSRIRVALALLPEDAAQSARLRGVEDDLADLDRLIDDVLTMARLDATGLPVHLERVDAGELARQVVERATGDPALSGREVRVKLGDGSLVFDADGTLLRRAVWNLIENAAKYGAPPIVVEARREGAHIVLAVSDEGFGIPPAERQRVLEPFYRLDKAHTPGPSRGVGLGLSLARRIATVHGGTLRITGLVQAPERGCTVAIVLPVSGSSLPAA